MEKTRPDKIVIDGVTYYPTVELLQRCEVGARFVADAQGLLERRKPPVELVLRKLQAARNVLTGRIEEPPVLKVKKLKVQPIKKSKPQRKR